MSSQVRLCISSISCLAVASPLPICSAISSIELIPVSELFSGMFSVPRPAESIERKNEIIDIPYDSRCVSRFVELAYVMNPRHIEAPSWTEARSLLALLDEFGCTRLEKVVHSKVLSASAAKPFELLILASHRDDLKMARFALSKLCDDPNWKFPQNSHIARIQFGRMTPAYQLELYQRSYVANLGSDGKTAKLGVDWMKTEQGRAAFRP